MSTQTLPLSHPAAESQTRSVAALAAAYAHWLPRVAFASVFLFHGVGKFADLAGFAGMILERAVDRFRVYASGCAC
jgi:uncharacterized membrane protein YphA (DoxX/SURF4 family)